MNALQAAISEISGFAVFDGLAKEKIAALCANSTIATCDHRDILFSAGRPALHFGIVLSGAFKLSKPSLNGEDVIVHFSTPGDVVGAFIMAQKAPIFPISATAMGPSRFLKIPKENYLESWVKIPELVFRIQNLLSTRMNILQDQKVMSKAPLSQKVAALLLSLLERNQGPDEMVLPLPLTRKEIAENLGASVESVIRVMSEWSKQGIIETNDQLIRVIKPDRIIEELRDKS